MSKIKLILLLVILITGYLVYQVYLIPFLEKNPPSIKITHFPQGINKGEHQAEIALQDQESGLSEAVVRLHYRNKKYQIAKRSYAGEKEQKYKFNINIEELDLSPGTATIEIRAFDRSFWSNRSELSQKIEIDYQAPRLEALSVYHNVYNGGAEPVLYTVKDNNLESSGVKYGELRFRGQTIDSYDPSIRARNLYISFYTVHPEFYNSNQKIKLFAKDSAGNKTNSKFRNKVFNRSFKNRKFKISDQQKDKFKTLLSDNFSEHQQKIRAKLKNILGDKVSNKKWNGVFSQPRGVLLANFNDDLNYINNSKNILSTKSQGILLQTNPDQAIKALSSGNIIFTGELGYLGKTVIIDHGLGLTSLYSFLSKISVKPEQAIKQDDPIGISGLTGIAHKNSYYLEFLVHGIPSDPRGWWDQNWYREHLTEKIRRAKEAVGLPGF